MEQNAVLSIILKALDPKTGALPENFHLPTDDVAEDMRFLNGAEDGVRLYHMPVKEIDLTPYKEAFYRILAGNPVEAEKKLLETFAQKDFPGMVEVSGQLLSWMNEHEAAVRDANILKFAVTQLMTTPSKEMVKFALSIISYYTTEPDGEIAKIVRVFSLSDEFTFYAISIMKNWENGNDDIFEVAKRVNGWGKIHAVHYLEASSTKIKTWLLTDGWKNKIRIAYNARDIATKLQLLPIMYRKDLSQAEFEGMCGLMSGLMEEKTVPGISALKDNDILMDAFLHMVNGQRLTREGVDAVQKIRQMRAKQN